MYVDALCSARVKASNEDRQLTSLIHLATIEEAQTGYSSLRDALGLRIDVELQGNGLVESAPNSAMDEASTATSSQESNGAVASPSRLALDECSPANTGAGMHRPPGL